VTRRLHAFFCCAAEPLNLAVLRIAVFAWLLWLFVSIDFSTYTQLPPQLRVAPPGYAGFFHLIPWNDAFVSAVRAVAIMASVAALLGWATRSAALVVCLCCLYLLGLPEFFGKIDHTHHHFVWVTALLAASRSGDALSIDAWRAALRRAEGGEPPPAPSASIAYALPLRFVWLLIGLSYLFPGLAKLAVGPAWVFSDNLAQIMHGFWLTKGFTPALRIDRYPLVMRSAAAAIVVFEVGFLPALFFPRLRPLAVAAGVAFHLLTVIYLRIAFSGLLLCYVAFVDWAALLAAARRRFVAHRTPARALSASERRPSIRGVVWVGSLLLAANLLCGVLDIDSWPFGVFPRFTGAPRLEYTALEVVVRQPDGATRPIDTGLRSIALQSLLRDDQAVRLAALREFVATHRVELQPGESLQLFEVTRSTVPEDRDKEPLRRTLLSQLDAAAQ